MNKIKHRLFHIIRHYTTKNRKVPLDNDYVNEMPIFQYAPEHAHKRNRVYVWGSTKTGALGIPFIEKPKKPIPEYLISPKRLHFGEMHEINTIAAGFGFTLFGTNDNKVYGSGLNADSQIGYHAKRANHPLETIILPQLIFLPDSEEGNAVGKILKLSAGRAHSVVLTDEGLYLLGNNSFGQCGRMIVDNEDYFRNNYINFIKKIDNKSIVDVICGQDHTVALMSDGSVYSCGWGADGQTGLGHYNVEAEFKKVNGDIANEKIVKITCRSDFVIALNDKNEVFGWGNTEYSQLITKDGSQQVAHPAHIKILDQFGGIKDVDSGGSFCIALTKSGDVVVWGFGLLGAGPQVTESRVPVTIPKTLFGYNDFNIDSHVVSVHCGLSHMAAVTNKGDLYTWGRNRSSCLGLGHTNDQNFPFKVAIGASVSNVACGFDHTVALCKSYLSKEEKSN